MNSLFVSPHSDDSVLFGAYTLMREKPLVLTVTSSYIQANRGENITAQQRIGEDIVAMKILGCPIVFGQLRDDVLDSWGIENLLSKFQNFDKVYIPAIQGGNAQHDLIGKVALKLWPKAISYATYAKGEWKTKGKIEIKPTGAQIDSKKKALDCYASQLSLPATAPHFDAARKEWSEWLV